MYVKCLEILYTDALLKNVAYVLKKQFQSTNISTEKYNVSRHLFLRKTCLTKSLDLHNAESRNQNQQYIKMFSLSVLIINLWSWLYSFVFVIRMYIPELLKLLKQLINIYFIPLLSLLSLHHADWRVYRHVLPCWECSCCAILKGFICLLSYILIKQ